VISKGWKTALKRKIANLAYAAEFLHVPRSKLYRMLRRGEIPGAFKVGGVWRVDLDELERFLATKP
jgi:excisionase family DNA binding protein